MFSNAIDAPFLCTYSVNFLMQIVANYSTYYLIVIIYKKRELEEKNCHQLIIIFKIIISLRISLSIGRSVGSLTEIQLTQFIDLQFYLLIDYVYFKFTTLFFYRGLQSRGLRSAFSRF